TEMGLFEHDNDSGVVRFRHELLREAVRGALLDAQRHRYASRLLAALQAGTSAQTREEPGNQLHTVDSPMWIVELDEDDVTLAARLAAGAGETVLATAAPLDAARRLMVRGLPRAAARAAEAAVTGPASAQTAQARELLVEALALAGEVERALEEAAQV